MQTGGNLFMDAPGPPEIFVFGEFRFDRRSGGLFRCARDGKPDPVTVGSRALDVLGVLLGRHGDLVSKDEILAAVWPDTTVDEANLHVQISALRRVLDQDRAEASCIQTVPGRGYRFVADVMRVAAGTPVTAADAPEMWCWSPDRRRQGAKACAAQLPARRSAADRARRGGAAAAWLGEHGWFRNAAGRAHLSIVVLPLANIGSDPEQEYFADAITDDLTTDLSRIAGSVVIAHSTAQTYRDKAVDVAADRS